MRIQEITIHNYKSIKDLSLKCQPLVALVGPNNAGKSNILSALEFALTSAKPAAEDLFAFRGEGESELWVELEFADLTDQEATGEEQPCCLYEASERIPTSIRSCTRRRPCS